MEVNFINKFSVFSSFSSFSPSHEYESMSCADVDDGEVTNAIVYCEVNNGEYEVSNNLATSLLAKAYNMLALERKKNLEADKASKTVLLESRIEVEFAEHTYVMTLLDTYEIGLNHKFVLKSMNKEKEDKTHKGEKKR